MARIRSLKPGFFTNEDLAELPFEGRLCFAGLWTLADREGRLEDRPRRIKAALFPYDELDIDRLLSGLAEKAFIVRYVADGAAYIAMPTFLKHQRPKTDEAVSVIPAPVLEHPRGKETTPRSYKGQGDLGSGQGTGDSGADGAPLAADGAVRRRAEEFMVLWNELTTPPIARCRDLTSKRRRHIQARLTELSWDDWRGVFERIQASAFCRGENDRGWMASFDWVIGSPDVAVKTLEGKYDNRRKEIPAPSRSLCPHSTPCDTITACRDRTVADGRAARGAA